MENLLSLYRLCNQHAARRAGGSSQLAARGIPWGSISIFTWDFIASTLARPLLDSAIKESSEEAEGRYGRRSKMQIIFFKSRSRSLGREL